MGVLLLLVGIAFGIHLIWERLHIRWYTGYEKMQGRLPVYVWASVGDSMYTLLAVALVSFFKGTPLWFMSAHVSDFIGVALIGLWIAVFVEYKAMALKRWEYTEAMPRLFGLGLSPLIQMTVLLPLSVFITMEIMRFVV